MIAGRQITTSLTAYGEFSKAINASNREEGSGRTFAAGPTEFAGAVVVQGMLVGNLKPDIPSQRVADLPESGGIGAKDKLIFGTADALNLQIITGDARFVNAAKQQGVVLNAIPIPEARFAGR